MRQLFQTALFSKEHRLWICFSIVAMIMLTFASQLEILALGIITKKGPDFFELFAPIENQKLAKTDRITYEELLSRWKVLDRSASGTVTKTEALDFLSSVKGDNLVEEATLWVNRWLPINRDLGALALFIVFVALFKAISLFFQRFCAKLVAIRLSRDLRQKYFEHIQILPMHFYQQYNMGSLSSRAVGDATMVAEAINGCLVNYLQTPFTVISTLLLCFYTSWKLSLILFFGLPFIIAPIIFLAKRVKSISKQLQKNQETFASTLLDFLAGIQTVKVFAMEEFSLKKYREQNEKMAALEQKSARYDLSSRPIVHTVGMFCLAIALLYGLYILQMNVSEILVYCGLLYVFYEPIKKFAEENTRIQRGVAAAERMQEVLHLTPDIQDRKEALELDGFRESIEFDRISFGYDSEHLVLKNVSFTIKKGEKVAIVGPTGSGKSTLVQLLPRLFEPQTGEIRIDGHPLAAYTQKSLRENMAFVPQKPFLFLDTIRENIAFGRPFSLEEVKIAAKRAHADEFIVRFPNGYETPLLEMGKNLSGGQLQRLAIARALVKKAPLLILDEATSSLDAASELGIKQALNELRGHITQIIIAHRLSTIEDADKIIFLERGQKIAEGTKEELLKSCPAFKAMWDILHASHPTLQE